MKMQTLYGTNLFDTEKDNCAIIARVRKDGVATHGNVKRTLLALENMGHRTGEIDLEGDGAGLQTDIPRQIWMERLESIGLNSRIPFLSDFIVAHIMIRPVAHPNVQETVELIISILKKHGLEAIYSAPLPVRSEVLGQRAKRIEPAIYAMGIVPIGRITITDKVIHEAHLEIENDYQHVHFASFSPNSVIYKVRGDVKALINYYPDLKNPEYKSAISLAHGRYSTNTDSNYERAQMFSTLGHNGEINTILRLRREAEMMGLPVVCRGSDSQDVDRLIEGLMFYHNLSLMEAMELVFPPIWSEIKSFPEELQNMYIFNRRMMGMIAQGPAAIIARQGDEIVFSVDALGLRPLWFGETDKEYFASSEKGVIELEEMHTDPVPLAPGEKRGFLLRRPITQLDASNSLILKGGTEVFDYPQLQKQVLKEFNYRRTKIHKVLKPHKIDSNILVSWNLPEPSIANLKSLGWFREDMDNLESMSKQGKDPVASTGYDGPLAILRDDIVNIPEFLKETVAVVTNPAIDREREQSHFSLRVFLGARPNLGEKNSLPQIQLDHPVLLDGKIDPSLGTRLEDLFTQNGPMVILEELHTSAGTMKDRLDEFVSSVISKVQNLESTIIILSDVNSFKKENAIDPFLALGKLNEELRKLKDKNSISLRRKTSLVLHSGQLRNVHDCCVAIGLGADAISPYMIWNQLANNAAEENQFKNTLVSLVNGIEKVISTMGIHEISGYGPIFASIGLAEEITSQIGITSVLSYDTALGFNQLENQYEKRRAALVSKDSKLPADNRLYVKLWKSLGDVSQNKNEYKDFEERYKKLTDKQPVSLRHIISMKKGNPPVEVCDIKTGPFDAPFYISAMSFGSQGEVSYRAYAEGAFRSNILCMNGEGGELLDLMGKYYHHRGQQIASARFGVNALLLNSSKYLEIKVGQGAKPGEGGLLPGFKVTAQIAEARHATKGIDLISPSNNHDIYSIEDLAQLIEELKTVNQDAKVSVKIPAIPNIGPIACGVAKANADIITISGYDGGTGAARVHSLKYVGFPVELAVFEAHESLLSAGLRSKVDLWADGGAKSTDDILILMALGANRVGFGTLAMVAIGCTICRDCHTGTCHTGITAHFPTQELAFASGLKEYEPRNPEQSVNRLVHLFDQMKVSLKEKGASLGYQKLSDIVGKRQLLEQSAFADKVSLSSMFIPSLYEYKQNDHASERVIIHRPRTSLSRIIAQKVNEQIDAGAKFIKYQDDLIGNGDRALGAATAGSLAKYQLNKNPFEGELELDFSGTTIPGNGLGAFITDGMIIRVQGGGQDGVAKSASGGKIVILKGYNHDGLLVDGSVGKCFAYGAQNGKFFVQGTADSRACIRLSGANVVFGARLKEQIQDHLPNLASRAHLKGFAFEYMTGGTVVVLGDPGPWICAGFSGGVIYAYIDLEKGMTVDALKNRLAPGAKVKFLKPSMADLQSIKNLLVEYTDELKATGQKEQTEEAEVILKIAENAHKHFSAIRYTQDPIFANVKRLDLLEMVA
ncbi:MAG: glutamate synthase-related protein [Ignavibacteriaceae bacterium]|nr:glutamate synthase-related protein [Ignavibacteriaceae bacterium]